MSGPFAPGGYGFNLFGCGPTLPRQGCSQFQASARLWYGKLNGSTIIWGTNNIGMPGAELDLHDDLGLRKHQYISEYEARCQIRQNWGIRYSFMPLRYRDNKMVRRNFWFGNWQFSTPFEVLTRWDRNIHRWDVVYDWFQAPHAVSSIFAGYALYDDKLVLSDAFASRSRSQGFGLASGGMSLDRLIRCVGFGTASVHCRGSVQFLEGYVGWDGMAVGRVSIPMDRGRFGYIEAGWRWISLERKYPSNADKTSIDGLIGNVGLVF